MGIVVDAEFGGEVDSDVCSGEGICELCSKVMACGSDCVYEDLYALEGFFEVVLVVAAC